MTSPNNPSITFYDIASNQPLRTFAPNPWKTRYALNFKRLPYQTQWTEMPDIASVREKLGVPANRTLPDGRPYHTLPAIQDHSTGAIIGDSFEIALYLDKTYPAPSPRLIQPGTTGLTAAFNAQVDGLFTKFVILGDQMPFDAHVLDRVQEMFAKRMGVASLESMQPSGEEREKLFVRFENALGEFVKAYWHVGGTTDYFWAEKGTKAEQAQRRGREEVGPFLDVGGPVYADFIVGAWLATLKESLKEEEWLRVRTWQGGFWGRLHDALEPLREIK